MQFGFLGDMMRAREKVTGGDSVKTTFFYNASLVPARIRIHSGENFLISSRERTAIQWEGDALSLWISSGTESWRDKKGGYIFSLEASYHFDSFQEGQTLTIIHQRDQAGVSVYLDRMFLFEEEVPYVTLSLQVLGLEAIRKTFRRACRRRFFLVTPIEETPGLVIVGLIAGAILTWFLGWKAAAVYFPALYGFLLLFNFVTGKIGDKLFQRIFKVDSEKKEFENLCREEALLEYYREKELGTGRFL